MQSLPEPNPKCDPQNDMDCYYNSAWKHAHKWVKSSINNFTIEQDKIDSKMYNFVKEAKPGCDIVLNNLIKLRNSHYKRKDTSKFLEDVIHQIHNISNITSLANTIKFMNIISIPTVCTLSVIPHFKSPDIFVCNVGENILTLDHIEMYSDEDMVRRLISLLVDIHRLVKHWGYVGELRNFVSNVITFELLLSKSNLSQEETINPKVTHNSMLFEDFLEEYDFGNFWKIILGEYVRDKCPVFYENKKMMVFFRLFLQNMCEKKILLHMLKDYLIFCLARRYGPFTSISASFDKISTLNHPMSDFDISITLFYSAFGYYLQSKFESENYDPKKTAGINDIFTSIKKYCINSISESNMFEKETKMEALNKLYSLEILIGKQCYQVDTSEMPELCENDLYHNLMTIDTFYFYKMVRWIGKPINRYYLSVNNDLFSFILNAYYDPLNNMIFVPTSLTSNIFYNADFPAICNYGSLGAVIGHEMIHCFDTTGAQYDHLGHLVNWWTEKDYEVYNKEISKVIDYYSSLRLNGMKLNSQMSVSENLADIVGVKLSLKTYIKKYMPNVDIKNLTDGEKEHLQLFFERWAKMLRELDEDEVTQYSLKFDVHSPNIVRVNGPLSHIDEYYRIFDVRPTDQNYLEPYLRTHFLGI